MENINQNQCQKTNNKNEYKCPKTNPEEVGLKFDECQRKRLYELKDKTKDTNSTEVYKFIQDQLPDNKSKDQKALDIWLDVAISTNAKSGDIIDVTLRNTTKETLKRTLGSDYKEQYGNKAEFDEKYQEISNQTKEKIFNDLAHGCKIDTDYIVHLDAENFQKFDPKFNPRNGKNSGRIKIGDSPVAPVDEAMFGKDYIKETTGAGQDRIEGGLNTAYSMNNPFGDKITPPTTATSAAVAELISQQKNKYVGLVSAGTGASGGAGSFGGPVGMGLSATFGFIALLIGAFVNRRNIVDETDKKSMKLLIKTRDKYKTHKKYQRCKCKNEDEREEAKKYIKDQEAQEAQAGNNSNNPLGIIPLGIIPLAIMGAKYINSTAEKKIKQLKNSKTFKKFTDLFQPKKEEDSMKLINISNDKLEKLGAYGLSFSTSEGLSPGILKEKEANIGDFKTKEEYFKHLYAKAIDAEEDYNTDKEE